MRPLWLFVAMTGCLGSDLTCTCEAHITPVADDEATDAGTAESLLARITGVREEPAALEDGTPVTATLQIERGEGTAEWVDLERVKHVERRFGFGVSQYTLDVVCDDVLRVPVEVSLVTDDGSLDLVFEASGRIGTPTGGLVGGEPYVEADVPFEGSGMPVPDDLDLDDWTEQEAFANVDFESEGHTRGQAGWSGRDGSSSESRRLLDWPVDP